MATTGFEYGGFEYGGFEYGGYAQKVLANRNVAPNLIHFVVSRGRSAALGDGKTLFSDTVTGPNGHQRSVFVITQSGKIVTSWAEKG